jgi:hypothetical protein
MPMLSQRLTCLALVLPVFLLSMCLVPVGHGPFAAAYGPTAKFQALKVLFLLMFLMAAPVSSWDILSSAEVVPFSHLTSREDFAQITPYQLSLNSAFRC